MSISKSDGLGYAQSWKSEKLNRALNTNYTNTKGKPIFISVYVTTSSITNITITVDGKSITNGMPWTGAASNGFGSGYALIPNGSVYSVQCATGTIQEWMELS